MPDIKYASMPAISLDNRQWPSAAITTSPIWCAVDLRDGNQALPNPMTPQQKQRYFDLLIDIGFKEIEVGFPSASQDDFDFVRNLIENDRIPDDVTISVLTQCRPHLIERTFESIVGVKNCIFHIYIATSELHRWFVFGLEDQQVIDTAVTSMRQIREGVRAMSESKVMLEFSPEEFTDTSLEFSLAVCDAVVDEWAPDPGEKVILNLPQTVERRLPNQYADMIEAFSQRCKYPEQSIISLHVHNDMGMAVASTTQALMAGAHRVEGTLFGHGERTGNVDLITVALNLEYLGIDTGLDFSRLPEISQLVAEVTQIEPHPRTPYSGELVFTAFSGSHQDAIHKGLSRKDELIAHFDGWKVPYLHVSPSAIGRDYERFIRINSQSGKGGIAHVLERDFHVQLPRWVQIDFARHIQSRADDTARELSRDDVWDEFTKTYVQSDKPIKLINYWPRPSDEDPSIIDGEVHLMYNDERQVLKDSGNGPISAFVHALKQIDSMPEFVLDDYEEETMGRTADAEAVCFVLLSNCETEQQFIGVGFGGNIDQAAVRAVMSGVNRMLGT